MKSSIFSSIILSLLLGLTLIFAHKYYGDGLAANIVSFLGYDTASGLAIKLIIYLLFIFSFIEVLRIRAASRREASFIGSSEILDGRTINSNLLQTLVDRAEHMQRTTPRLLLSLLVNAGHALLNSKLTISEGLHLVQSQMTLYGKDQKSELAVIGNVAASMIAFGLMGSLIGISGSLSNFGTLLEQSTDNANSIKTIFSYFSTAWNTTLLGFVFSVMAQYLLHNLNHLQTTTNSKIEQHLIDNLFSRLRNE